MNLKRKLNSFTKLVFPLFLCLLIVMISAAPAFANTYDGTIAAGDYAIVEQPKVPEQFFAASVKFSNDEDTYNMMFFRPAGTQEPMQYDALYYNDTLVCYWISGVCYWLHRDFGYITFTQDFVAGSVTSDNTFYWWFLQNSTKLSTPPSDNDTQEQIKDALTSGWDEIKDMYSGSLLPGSFAAFSAVLAVFWESPVLMKIVTLAVAFVLCGFIVFGESKHG